MEKINAILVLEILGRPIEYVKEALDNLVVKLGGEKGVVIKNKTLHEPKPAQDSKNLFTSFAELEVEFETIQNYLGIVFAYMPSHIDIISPEKLALSNHDLNEIGNNVLQRVHGYDAVVKNVITEREYLIGRIKDEAPALFKELSTPPEERKNSKQKGKKSKKKR